MKSVALHNLGCKVNAYEIEVMQQKLEKKGYKIVPFAPGADIYIINTCTVTNIADRKSRQMLHKAKKMNPDAVVVATGCYVQTASDQGNMDPCIDLAVGNNKKKDITDILEEYFEHQRVPGAVMDISTCSEYEEMKLQKAAQHTRAYIKIQDGCNQFCSYCVIPYARGRVRSRKEDNILDEVRGLAAAGYKEIVVTGIHISSYGLDFLETDKNSEKRASDKDGEIREIDKDGERIASDKDGVNREADTEAEDYLTQNKDIRLRTYEKEYFLHLLQKMNEIDGIERIRLGSLEPRIITQHFAEELKKITKLCPHFHLSLQSGCDTVLKRMNRHYTTEEYMERVKILRNVFDQPAITTDIITGFPQETEEEFDCTLHFVEKICFYEIHVFKYSRRKGTVADEMPGQIEERIKEERSRKLLALTRQQSLKYRRQFLLTEQEVLLEEEKTIGQETYRIGHTRQYVMAALKTTGTRENQIISAKAVDMLNDEILLLQ